jgi:Ser/Thr protein kinase RdoA (MazF antagonist)
MNMKPYKELTRLGRLRRNRQLAETALNNYGLGGARLTFLRYFANITYRVDVPVTLKRDSSSPYVPNRYLLRILLSDNWENAQGEMAWLAALSNGTDLPIPAPLLTQDGELLTRIVTPGIPGGRIVSMMLWVDGRKLTTELGSHHLRAWGRMLARMHKFAAGWQPDEGFKRFVWDWEGLLGGRGFSCAVEELVGSMPKHLQEPFQFVSDETREVMANLGTGSNAYGMIHGDMYTENLLFKGGEAIPIDFEDCGFGYWLWDIAVALNLHPWTEEWYWKRDAFLDGYTQVHTLPEEQLRYLDLFIAADNATGVLWATSFIRNEPLRQSEHEDWRNEAGTKLLRYLELH